MAPTRRSSTTPGWARRLATSTATRVGLLERIVREKRLTANAVVGFWPANAVGGDDIAVWCDETRKEALATFRTLRQQMAKPDGRPNVALADFVAPAETGVADYVGAFAVTTGHGLEEIVSEFEAANDDYSAILAKALADRLAEAFAERLHERVRRELWGYAPDEASSNPDLIAERYQGIRPAPGYPACPDHTEKATLFDLLEAEARAGITPDRVVRDVAGRVGIGLLPLEPGQPLLRGRPDRARPARGLRRPKGRPDRRGGALAGAEPGRRGLRRLQCQARHSLRRRSCNGRGSRRTAGSLNVHDSRVLQSDPTRADGPGQAGRFPMATEPNGLRTRRALLAAAAGSLRPLSHPPHCRSRPRPPRATS